MSRKVSKPKQLEAGLEHLASFPQLNPNPILELDADGRMVFCNRAAEEYLHKMGCSATANPFIPENLPEILQLLKDNKAAQITQEIELEGVSFVKSINVMPQLQVVRIYAIDISERKRAEEALELSNERLESLLELYQMKFKSEEEITDFALEEVVRLTRSTGGYLHFFNEDEQTIQLYAWSKEVLKTCTTVQEQHYPLDSAGVWADSARTRGPVIHNDYQSMTDKKGYPEGHFQLNRHLGIPIIAGDRIVGLTGVGNKELPYNVFDVLALSLYMNSMWSILHQKRMDLEHAKMEEELLHAATHDSLTGILNRQTLEKIIQAEIERAKRYGSCFSLIMLDIDDFKKINDSFGHQAGDRALIIVADILRQNVRIVDSVGRWGGEEFVILVSETKGPAAGLVAEKLRNALVTHNFDEASITASFGVSTYKRADSLDTMIKRVDERLYRAKGLGKNRVER